MSQREEQTDLPVARVQSKSRISAIWIIPLVALAIGAWTLAQSYLSQGPEVRVRFATAAGLVAGETRVKTLDVEIGVVELVELADDFESVTAVVRLDPKAAPLLTEDAQFWVVRPEIGSQGISGLSTILSGAYIQLSAGESESTSRSFRGMDVMPVTPPSTPGLTLRLTSDTAKSVNIGSPVLYNGFRVGRIEEVDLNLENGHASYSVFIDAPYDDLVTTTTRFWNASGVSVSVGVGGFNLNTESLEALVTGGVAFGVPEGSSRGEPAQNGSSYFLFGDVDSVSENPHTNSVQFVLLFDSSIRGLREGAPVDYRGLRVGSVLSVGAQPWESLWSSSASFSDSASSVQEHFVEGESANALPVVILIEPGWLGDDTIDAAEGLSDSLSEAVDNGLRASLAIGNLLTGSLYVSLDFAEDAEPAQISQIDGVYHLPTVASGLDAIEEKVAGFLSKLQSLPIENTLDNASNALLAAENTMAESKETLNALSTLLESPGTTRLPDSMVATLEDAREVLVSFGGDASLQGELLESLRLLKEVLTDADSVLQTYEKKPNAFVFPSSQRKDPEPTAGRVEEN